MCGCRRNARKSNNPVVRPNMLLRANLNQTNLNNTPIAPQVRMQSFSQTLAPNNVTNVEKKKMQANLRRDAIRKAQGR